MKIPNLKFHGHRSSGSHSDTCGRTDEHEIVSRKAPKLENERSREWNGVHYFTTKPNRCTNFTNLVWHETLQVSDSSSVHHQEFIYSTSSNGYVIQALYTQLSSKIRMELHPCPARNLSTNLYDIYQCRVYSE